MYYLPKDNIVIFLRSKVFCYFNQEFSDHLVTFLFEQMDLYLKN